MPVDAMYADPMAHRYYDYPIVGSIFRLPDIKSLVRGPTIVRLRTGVEVRVPPTHPKHTTVPAQVHDTRDHQGAMSSLMAMLSGKRQAAARATEGISFDRHQHEMPIPFRLRQ